MLWSWSYLEELPDQLVEQAGGRAGLGARHVVLDAQTVQHLGGTRQAAADEAEGCE